MPLLFTIGLIVISTVSAQEPSELRFSRHEGSSEDHFFRRGKVCAQVQIENNVEPYLTIGFPAGNTGALIKWAPEPNLHVEVSSAIEPAPAHSNPRMNGVRFNLEVSGTKLLIAKGVMLDSMRFIRDWRDHGQRLGGNKESITLVDPHTIRLNQKYNDEHEYEVLLHNPKLTFKVEGQGFVLVSPEPQSRLEVTAWTSEKPLTPVPNDSIFKPGYFDPEFAMLAFKEGFLAGFINYMNPFARDTLISLALMLPGLQNDAIEDALTPIVEAINEKGELPHEQEQSSFSFKKYGDFETHYDYKMIDDRLMLPKILERYFRGVTKERANAFLDRKALDGKTFRAAFKRNLLLVAGSAAPFTENPVATNLLHLKPGEDTGNWRDSHEGLGYGRIPFDVNVALVPAALKAANYFFSTKDYGLYDEDLGRKTNRALAVWTEASGGFFQVRIGAAVAETLATAHALKAKLTVAERPATAREVRFFALALNADGTPVKIMHSDVSSLLLFGEPSPEILDEVTAQVFEPYPLGLMTPVGLLISNAAFAEPKLQPLFSPTRYHGENVWAFQQGVMAMGLDAQLKRNDLLPALRLRLRARLRQMYDVLGASTGHLDKEYWTWQVDDAGKLVYRAGGLDKPCRPQLWSKATSFVYQYLQNIFSSGSDQV